MLAVHLLLLSTTFSVARDRPDVSDSLASKADKDTSVSVSLSLDSIAGSLHSKYPFDIWENAEDRPDRNIFSLRRTLWPAQSDTLGLRTTSKINSSKLAVVVGADLAVLGGLYVRLHKAWWNNGNAKFHFYNDDWYVRNVDKAGHFYGGILFAEGFGTALKWPGYDEESSALYGGLLSAMIYTGIEIKDGFAPQWGFSVGDIGSSVLGAFYPYLQKKVSLLEDFNFKWSYWPSKSPYYRRLESLHHNDQLFADDYEGQTFWLSVNIRNYLPGSCKSIWPDFLNLAGGVSVEKLDGNGAGNLVFILSPDIDFTKLFKTDSGFLNSALHLLNLLHLPLPALRISPYFRGYTLYLHP